jgi:hypothetical protein
LSLTLPLAVIAEAHWSDVIETSATGPSSPTAKLVLSAGVALVVIASIVQGLNREFRSVALRLLRLPIGSRKSCSY